MTIRIPATLAFGLALAFAACGGAEPEGDVEVIDSAAHQRATAGALQQGMSMDEVRNRLGEPRTRVTMDGGLERWTYYNFDAQGRVAAKTLIIFGDDGKVVEISNMSP